jgi:cyanophycinase-like exopeptidase
MKAFFPASFSALLVIGSATTALVACSADGTSTSDLDRASSEARASKYSPADPTSADVIGGSHFAVAALSSRADASSTYKMVRLEKAESLFSNGGMNYRLTMTLRIGDQEERHEVIVFHMASIGSWELKSDRVIEEK